MVRLLTSIALALSLVSHLVFAAPAKDCSHTVKETVPHPKGWVKQGRPPADHVLQLRIGLPQPNFSVLEKHLYEISHPDHERYGAHLSKVEVEELIAPSPESIKSVDEWLALHGLSEEDLQRSPAKDWVNVRVPVSVAEKMLDTTYHVWTHIESGDTLIRTLSYSVPDDVHAHVDLVMPTTMFSRTQKHKTTLRFSTESTESVATGSITLPSGVTVDASCNTTVTITCLKELYNAVGYKSSAKNGNQIGITGYLGQFVNLADLQDFYADQRPDALNSTFKFFSVAGGQNSQNVSQAGDEADLDSQFAFGLTFPTPGTFWSTGGMPPFKPDDETPTDTNEPYTSWLDFVLASENVPQTISTSYGDDEQTVPESFALRACAGFAALGARGVSVLFSSGDGGVGNNSPDEACFTNDGHNKTTFLPVFPASCPFVTAVGGTIHVPETAVDFSGGGFSNLFPRPEYQESAVAGFLDKLPKGTYAGLFNPNGRAYPDVAAQADNFRVFFQGKPASLAGTSCAAPTFSAIVSLLNDARLSSGLPSLGFLNPFLYSKGFQALNDITIGNNPGCGTPGFNATKGWDPITGLGTPNFFKLKDLVL